LDEEVIFMVLFLVGSHLSEPTIIPIGVAANSPIHQFAAFCMFRLESLPPYRHAA
jgi:hypothetical protein